MEGVPQASVAAGGGACQKKKKKKKSDGGGGDGVPVSPSEWKKSDVLEGCVVLVRQLRERLDAAGERLPARSSDNESRAAGPPAEAAALEMDTEAACGPA